MDIFALIVLGGIAVVFLAFVGLGLWNKQSVGEIAGKSDQRRLGVQAEIEGDDISQMVDAHNDSRRRRGKEEVSEGEIRARAKGNERASIKRARSK